MKTIRKPVLTTVTGHWALVGRTAPGDHLLHAVGGHDGGSRVDLTVQLTVTP